ncbi:MAG TPA: hypothetical protein VGM33_06980 [Baekduia sp.]
MIATLVSALALVLAAALGGQLICALFGARRWTPAAPAVGLSVMMIIAMAGPHLPGRMTLPFIVTALLTLGGAVQVAGRPEDRPPAGVLLAGGLTFLITLIPFYAQQRFGILGVGFDNDNGVHLLFAGSYRDAALEAAQPLLTYYPFGPHAVAAELAHGLGLGLDGTFTGLTIAMPVLTAITVFGLLRRIGWPAAVLASVAAAMPYLVAAYLGQGSFKEVMFPVLLLGTVGLLGSLRRGEIDGPARLVSLGLVVGGVVSMYSYPGLAWIGGLVVVAVVAFAIPLLRAEGEGVRGVWRRTVALIGPAIFGGVVLVFAMIPQAPRVRAFWQHTHSTGSGTATGIAKDDLGNLAGPLHFLESTGVWFSPDYRFPPVTQTASTLLGILVLAAAAWGAVRLLRRREPELVAGAVVCLLIAAASAHSQSPYTTAKAFVIVSPFLVTLAAVGLLERRTDPVPLRTTRIVIAIGLLAVGAVSSFMSLRFLPVGPRAHEQQLAKFRPLVKGKSVLLTLNDEFGAWYLSGAIVAQPLFPSGRRDVGGAPVLPVKEAGLGHAYDFDSFGSSINRFDAVVMPRDPSASQPPANFRLQATSGPWALYQRTGPGKLRGVLSGEQAEAGQQLVCSSPEGQAVLKGGGVAGIRRAPVRVMAPAILAGSTVSVPVTLSPGRWLVNIAYGWRDTVHLTGPGLDTVLPASLDRQSARYPAGQVQGGALTLKLTAKKNRISERGLSMGPAELSFTPVGTERTVPVRQACGHYLDWYEPAAG